MATKKQGKLPEVQPITQSILNEQLKSNLKAFVSVGSNSTINVNGGLAEYTGLQRGDNLFIQAGAGVLVINKVKDTSDQVPFRLNHVNGDSKSLQFKSPLLKRHIDKLNKIETNKSYRFNLDNYSSPVEWPLILKLEDSTNDD